MRAARLLGAPAVVVGHALVQTLLVLSDPTPELTLGFVASVVASSVAVVLAVWLLVALVTGSRRSGRTLLGVVLLTLLAALAGLLTPLVVPLVLVLGAPFLVAGRSAPARLRDAAGRSVTVALVSVVLGVAIWLGAVASGLFLGPVRGAAATWVGLGLVAALVLRMWAGVLSVGRVRRHGDGSGVGRPPTAAVGVAAVEDLPRRDV